MYIDGDIICWIMFVLGFISCGLLGLLGLLCLLVRSLLKGCAATLRLMADHLTKESEE